MSDPMCDRFPGKFDVQTSYKPSNYVLGLIFVVNIKFPPATYQQQKNSIARVTGLDVKKYIIIYIYIYIIISIYVIKALFFLFPLLFSYEAQAFLTIVLFPTARYAGLNLVNR